MMPIIIEYDLYHRDNRAENRFLSVDSTLSGTILNLMEETIRISDSLNIVAVQIDFNRIFPYLRLEIITQPGKENGSLFKKLIPSHKTLGEYRTNHSLDSFILSPDMTISMLEEYFENIYGLKIKVFRKSGKAWIETSLTGAWTLAEQNKEGELLSNRN